MKNVVNPKQILLSIVLILVLSVPVSLAVFHFSQQEVKTHYAVLDIEDAISKTVVKKLQVNTDNNKVKSIVSGGRNQVENWLETRLEAHCAAPCVVFSKGDVLFGDVVDLNKQYELEILNGKK
ncbi:hypothetical protein JCM30760_25930 [Thiomicrorhabdus hydrogeniphila]